MHCTHVAPAGTGQLPQREARAHRVLSATAQKRVLFFSPRAEATRSARAERTLGRCGIQAPLARAQLAARPEAAQRTQAACLLCCHRPRRLPLPSSRSPAPAQDLPPRHPRLVPWPPERAGEFQPNHVCRQFSKWEASGRQYRRCSHVGQGCWVERCVAYHAESNAARQR